MTEIKNDRHQDFIEAPEDEHVLDLRELFFLLIKNIWLIIVFTVVFAVAVGLFTQYGIDKKYESSTILTIISKSDSQSSDTFRVSTAKAERFSLIAKTHTVLSRVSEEAATIHGIELSPKELTSLFEISTINDTDILRLKVQYTDPEIAAYLADTITQVTIQVYEEIYYSSDEVKWLDKATVNYNQVSPNLLLNTLIGFIIGGIIAVGIILFKELFNRKVRSQADIERLGIPFLGYVPEINRRHIK